MTTVTISVPEGLYERLVQWAAVNKRSIDSEVIARLEENVPDPEIGFDMSQPPPAEAFERFMASREQLHAHLEKEGIDPEDLIAEFKKLRRQEKRRRQELREQSA